MTENDEYDNNTVDETATDIQQNQDDYNLDLLTFRDIGDQAHWMLSSRKMGFGVENLRDDQVETFWQSDGNQPHLINIMFSRKTSVYALAVYLDYRQDESYTPQKILVRAGYTYHDLQDVCQKEFNEPCGWTLFPLSDDDQ
ncbi:galactose-binding like protein [Rozella allomycis CSF55]|uniref:Galactose-binding like protein n=1 Tax=Rozella allomycis (strain CSF55) TaxID=988480 RepID=A0A4P9YPX7_ROZAC|nr:galactose-binding like protein [Rozella allomycis CSF55]